jgi:hypothetical protein
MNKKKSKYIFFVRKIEELMDFGRWLWEKRRMALSFLVGVNR